MRRKAEAGSKTPLAATIDLEKRIQRLIQSPAYKLASNDPAWLDRDALRAVRLQLEFLKADLIQEDENIHSTVVVFGSARVRSPEDVERDLLSIDPNSELALRREQLNKQLRQSAYYDEARKFANIVSHRFQAEDRTDFVVVTGADPALWKLPIVVPMTQVRDRSVSISCCRWSKILTLLSQPSFVFSFGISACVKCISCCVLKRSSPFREDLEHLTKSSTC